MRRASYEIQSTWDGEPLAGGESARVTFWIDPTSATLEVEVQAAYYGDPAPKRAAGSCEGLWDFEVVELLLVGAGQRYLEIELGPHGHYLGLGLQGRRCIEEEGFPIGYRATIEGASWHGRASVDLGRVPARLVTGNAFAIHDIRDSDATGAGHGRRYLAAHALPGSEPDFHRIDAYPPIPWATRTSPSS